MQQIASGISISVSVVIAQQAASWVTAHSKDLPPWFPPVVAIVVYSMGSLLIRFSLDLLLDNVKLLRRLILGKQFVEGIWFDLIFQNNVPIAVGHSEITFSDGKFLLGGEDFRIDGADKGHFRVDLVELSWPVLKYKYTYESTLHRDSGYGEAQFIERDNGPPLKYTGSFVSLKDGARFTFETIRIEDPELIQQFHRDLGRDGTVRRHLKQLIEERSRQQTPETVPG
jgi:hypothetical protein